ncbi:hypothetical protein ACFZAU_03905 [Streptomyces sp. NPDC008238]
MFNRLGIRVLPPDRRYGARLQLLVDGDDLVHDLLGPGGRGPLAAWALPPDRPGPLAATMEGRRVECGEPECTGGCCGCLSVHVRRSGGVVEWADWQGPFTRPPSELHFDARQYDTELARARADRWWERTARTPDRQ